MATHYSRGNWNATLTTRYYVPFTEFTEATVLALQHILLTPFGGTLTFSVILTSRLAMGSTVVGVERNRGGVDIATDTQVVGGAFSPGIFSFSVGGWTDGDEFAITVNPTTGGTNQGLHLAWTNE